MSLPEEQRKKKIRGKRIAIFDIVMDSELANYELI